jgi:predicted enzyme related to lactoylglutathione lyase
MNPVVHFEMPAVDRQRMADFYSKIFGWQTQVLGEEMGGYVLATTVESDPATGRPTKPGSINGGFYQKVEDPTMNMPSVVIGVENLDDHMKKVMEAGGKIIGEPHMIPGVGMWVSFYDTEGNRVSMLQPQM